MPDLATIFHENFTAQVREETYNHDPPEEEDANDEEIERVLAGTFEDRCSGGVPANSLITAGSVDGAPVGDRLIPKSYPNPRAVQYTQPECDALFGTGPPCKVEVNFLLPNVKICPQPTSSFLSDALQADAIELWRRERNRTKPNTWTNQVGGLFVALVKSCKWRAIPEDLAINRAFSVFKPRVYSPRVYLPHKTAQNEKNQIKMQTNSETARQ